VRYQLCCTGIGESAVNGLLRDELVGAMHDWSNVGFFLSRSFFCRVYIACFLPIY